MRDKVLAYALAVSVCVHLGILCFVGRTSASSHVQDTGAIKAIEVSMVKSPDDDPKPTPVEPIVTPEQPYKPVIQNNSPTPVPVPRHTTVTAPAYNTSPRPPLVGPFSPTPTRVAQSRPAGNPGGALNMGSTSSHGENLGRSGATPLGWVPGASNGTGKGSGSGAGVGRPEPVRGAVEGPGREAAPAPPPPAPDVDVRVCAESGMLPGPYCLHTVVKAFRPGRAPGSVCTVCKPKYVLADRSAPELISGSKHPKYPEEAKSQGIQGVVVVEYTIDTEGRTVGIKITSSSHNSDLDEAAVETIKSRKYKPAVQAGIPRNFRKRETFRFTLDNG